MTLIKLEDINEGWKNRTMVSFGVSRKLKMNSFMCWYKWISITLNNDVVKSDMIIKLGNIRNERTSLFSSLYSNFLKLNLERYYNYRSNDFFVENLPFGMFEILGRIQNKIRRRVKAREEKSKIISQVITIQEVLHDEYVPTTNNIENFKFNNIQVNHALSKYYQRNENDNFISTNENILMNPFF